MDDGFYTITYVGSAGMGMSTVLMEGGTVRGFDLIGGRLDGAYTRDSDGSLDFKVTLLVQAGYQLVTGLPAQERAFTVPLTATVAKGASDGRPVTIMVAAGPVEASFRFMRGV